MKKVVIVEDEPYLREELASIFAKESYAVSCVTEFRDVSAQIMDIAPDLVVLDINLPGENGFQVCRELKKSATFPVLVLTSRDQMKDELTALELGADEYLNKPCSKVRLLARASNLLKRYEGRGQLIEGYGMLFDRETYTFYAGGSSGILPRNQGRLLEQLLIHRGEVLTKEQLCQAVWGTSEFIDENALQVNLTRLKQALKKFGIEMTIEAVRGKGYRIAE